MIGAEDVQFDRSRVMHYVGVVFTRKNVAGATHLPQVDRPRRSGDRQWRDKSPGPADRRPRNRRLWSLKIREISNLRREPKIRHSLAV